MVCKCERLQEDEFAEREEEDPRQGLRLCQDEEPRRIYFLNVDATAAVCWRPRKKGNKAVSCQYGVARLKYNCRTCTAAAFDAEWTPTRPDDTGVALLQLAFWPSSEVFCIRMWKLQPAVRALRRLLLRTERGEAILAGFSIGSDSSRLKHHGINLEQAKAIDLQLHCTSEVRLVCGGRVSLCNAALQFLRCCLDKDPQMSDWEGRLSHKMLHYAALDAWVTLRLLASAPELSDVKKEYLEKLKMEKSKKKEVASGVKRDFEKTSPDQVHSTSNQGEFKDETLKRKK